MLKQCCSVRSFHAQQQAIRFSMAIKWSYTRCISHKATSSVTEGTPDYRMCPLPAIVQQISIIANQNGPAQTQLLYTR